MKAWQIRTGVLAVAAISVAQRAWASPVPTAAAHEGAPIEAGSNAYYVRLAICAVLVLAGGLLAGLTLGLMSLDETNLHILATSGTETQREYARRIQPIRKNGHWLLVTLLLANTIINETLPILMDSVLGGGVMAVLVSTASIVLFGEIIPQSLCARYGLAIGAFFAYPVRLLQYVLAPLGYPIALLLDYVLGSDHGVIYKKAQLKELVSLSDIAHGGNLSADEITIIRGALELGEKRIINVMTELKNVYMVDIDAHLDRKLMTEMLRQGHSRVPVYEGSRANVVGVLLVKSLVLLDPDDAVPVRDARITSIPLVTPDVSLYDILNAFQEGGSHMAVVVGPAKPSIDYESTPLLGSTTETAAALSNAKPSSTASSSVSSSHSTTSPPPIIRKLSSYIQNSNAQSRIFGEISEETVRDFMPLGIITLEDVIEELIQEEIIDETDVFVDMRHKIKVMRAVKLAQNMAARPGGGALAEDQQQLPAKRRGLAFSSRRRDQE
ncbi:hypothetical protein GGF46_001389 [Coemansia sp. RSA 552]|nr:hypothetical protein GGF46_001389 [Coemansia sp. RSA 552]